MWAALFVGSLAGIIVFSHWVGGSFLEVASWSELGLMLVRKLPFIGPFVWIAIFSSHKFGIVSRLEDDYAYKEAVSVAYEGYKKQMESLDSKSADAVKKLAELVLHTLSLHPLRVYTERYEVPTPFSALGDTAGKIMKQAGGVERPAP